MPIQPKFTNAGKALQLRALAGEEILFTKIQIGSGELGETSYKTFNALLDPKITVPITNIMVADGYAKIRGYFDNKNLDEGIYYREVGLFAKNPDDPTKEILYAYVNYGREASFIADHTSKLIEHSVTFVAVVDDAENVSAVINGSAVYVDFTDMRKAIEEHNSDDNAHPGMASLSLEVYVDCNSTEDDELCDGSYEHPYKNIVDVTWGIPEETRDLKIILKTTGDYILDEDCYFGYGSLENIELVYNGSATHKPIIHGFVYFGQLNKVTISRIDFMCDGREWSSMSSKLYFDSCENVWITSVFAQCKTTDNCCFIDAYSSTVYVNDVSVLNMCTAISGYSSSVIHVLSGTFETTNENLVCDQSIFYLYSNDNMTSSVTEGLVVTPETMRKITNGEILEHLTSTANPHHVSLTDAQQQGGIIDVVHGGTGQETFPKGAILMGASETMLGILRGVGALFSEKSGEPKFGTLPVSAGGTGKTSFTSGSVLIGNSSSVTGKVGTGALWARSSGNPTFGTLPVDMGGTGISEFPTKNALLVGGGTSMPLSVLNPTNGALYNNGSTLSYGTLPVMFGGTGTTGLKSEIKDSAVDGARHGHFVIGFGSGPKILVCWGRISPNISEGVTVNFSSRCGNYFKDAAYTLVFSGNDIENGKITKNNTNFVIDSALVARAADWIAIGEVHE
ncbi:MAG: hypothetical protein U0M02_02465 [Acutalibacteraceae bacterium]|nr:hypothetical protein [Acutalibacteraceae bacterium]